MTRTPTFPTALTAPAVLTAGGLALSACGPYPVDASDQHDDVATGAAPVFGEVREEAFETSLAAESVTVEGEIEAGEADVDELFGEIDEGESGQLEITGDLDGTASQMSFSAGESSFTQVVVDGEEYFAGDEFAQLLAAELNDDDEDEEEADSVSSDDVAEIIDDAWVQFPDAESVYSAQDVLTTWQEELADGEYDELEAEEDIRDGEDVWIYTEDDLSIVVAAGDEPLILEISDGANTYAFDEWNESEAPEAPEDVITIDEILEEAGGAESVETGEEIDDPEITDAVAEGGE
ncbi:hypothetical protein [Nesterenkonia populi]|uniref:hypothetical protein n=1 Tax=Nesterenkonia populi TaxID=1591087 RepID=UPI0011BED867|nr:hypothetical protein [Nesterenkonia populi]